MIFVVVGLAWLLSALVLGSLLGRCVSTTDRHDSGAALDSDRPLYVADILRAQTTAPQG
ncbi:hypothetical protein [Modestobacter versicolor]|uniref:hypothetical protein n=1 Tax=Modestobacter versicolor TaxID=429133 RepID=UPI0034DEDC7F